MTRELEDRIERLLTRVGGRPPSPSRVFNRIGYSGIGDPINIRAAKCQTMPVSCEPPAGRCDGQAAKRKFIPQLCQRVPADAQPYSDPFAGRSSLHLDPPNAKKECPGYGECGYDGFCDDDRERLIKPLRSIDSRGGNSRYPIHISSEHESCSRQPDVACRPISLASNGGVREILVTNPRAGEHPVQ